MSISIAMILLGNVRLLKMVSNYKFFLFRHFFNICIFLSSSLVFSFCKVIKWCFLSAIVNSVALIDKPNGSCFGRIEVEQN